ncbi:TPM domain-containing protein [Streptococcus suis]|nr:TPM domain-containing protein [Streptococcus suis]MBY5038993.1 TPM domain-containing protein [Streptococcus suis]HEM6308580.1 TPM domain-containing protein [Streptococcus suis]
MKKYLFYLLGFLLLLFSLGQASLVGAEGIPARPIDSTVVDESQLLSSETIANIDQLNQTWAASEQQLQVGVYVTESLSTDIESLANATFRDWQVGFAGTDNGILLVIAIADREFRIESSDNAATVLTDVEAKDILESAREFFRQEDYDGGVTYIVQSIGDRFYGTSLGQEQLAAMEERTSAESDSFVLFLILILIFIIFGIIDKASRGRGGGPGNLLWMLVDDHHHYHNNHSSHSSSSYSGGGWSGGGGGGGGASSGW